MEEERHYCQPPHRGVRNLSYQAIYRIWRPQTFTDLVGQPHVCQTLGNALRNQHVAHAYLFCGPRGTGKTSAAKILAKAVNCLQPVNGEPCNTCEACTAITRGTSVDVEEIDAASNRGVDEIRQLRDKVQYAPANLFRKVYIIDEVHMLTTEAFNALLKTLEEPPAHALFVLATTEPHKIPSTIVSRCQRFDFRRIAPELMVDRLHQVCQAEGWTFQHEALWKIALAADGGLRDALGILEQTAAFGAGNITPENTAHVMGGVEQQALLQLILGVSRNNLTEAMKLLSDWYENGKDAGRIVHELLQVCRDLVIVKLSASASLPEHLKVMGLTEAATGLAVPWLMQAIEKLGETYTNLRYLDDPRLALETALIVLSPLSGTPLQEQSSLQPAAAASSSLSGQSASDTVPLDKAPSGLLKTSEARPTSKRSSAAEGGKSDSRKRDALRKLLAARDDEELQRVKSVWPEVLAQVKQARVQTHAWLMNGDPVLATSSVVVVTFSSKFHRDTVMKPEERSLIEQVIADVAQSPHQILALLREDWENYGTIVEDAPQNTPDLVETAVKVFGKDRVEIIDGE